MVRDHCHSEGINVNQLRGEIQMSTDRIVTEECACDKMSDNIQRRDRIRMSHWCNTFTCPHCYPITPSHDERHVRKFTRLLRRELSQWC